MTGLGTRESVWMSHLLILAAIQQAAYSVCQPRRLLHSEFLPYFKEGGLSQLSSIWEEKRRYAGKAIIQFDKLLSRLVIAVDVYLTYIDFISLEKAFYTS